MQRILLIGRGLMLGFGLLLGAANANAQVSGYMGHRLSLQANIELVPTLRGLSQNNNRFIRSSNHDGSWAISKRYGLEMNYATTRRRSVTVALDYFRTGQIKGLTYYDIWGEERAQALYAIDCYTLAVGGRFYKHVAPMGAYFELAGEVSSLTSKFKNYTYRAPTDISDYPKEDELKFNTKDIGINLGWGYSNIINNHLILDFGIRSHFSLLGFPSGFNYSSTGGEGLSDNDLIRARKGYHSILMFKMSVGYLF